MSVFLLIVSILFWVASIVALPKRPIYAPALSFLGLLCMSFCNSGDGVQWLPINSPMLYSWLSITIVVMIATFLQPVSIRTSSKGMAYIIGGAFVGLAVGLLGYSATTDESMLYGIMAIAVVIGIFFGYLIYSRTPAGRSFWPGSGKFFGYLLAKGFPTAVTVIQIGLIFVLLILVNNVPDSSSLQP